MDADGGDKHVVVSTPAYEGDPDWSPDGESLAFERYVADSPVIEAIFGQNLEIYTVDIETGTEQRLTTDLGYDACPAWAPDGTSLIFETYRMRNSDIWRVDSDGANAAPLIDSTADELCASFSPDGAQIVYSKGEEDGDDLGFSWNMYVAEADGSNSRIVGDYQSANGLQPSWSSDGTALVFQDLIDNNAPGIFMIAPDGSERRLLFFDGRWASSPDW